MFISYEELKAMEEQYCEQLRNAQAHLDVVRELLKFAEEKETVKPTYTEVVFEAEKPEQVETEIL